MERPSYLSRYLLDWESMDVVVGGRSALDSKFFLGPMLNADSVEGFLTGYGLDANDAVARAELFGNFQEALQFIRRYFLIEGTDEGLDMKIPNGIMMITDISDLFLMATGNKEGGSREEELWAEVVLKVMHTILHVDKDLRSSYFSEIQTQIFDRFYKYLYRDGEDLFFARSKKDDVKIPLVEFETKSKKTRDSVIIKLLHKAENVAEELFDRVGVRIVTENRFDTIRVIKFVLENYIVIPHNIKPSRSTNSLVDMEEFKRRHSNLIKFALRNNLSEEKFIEAMEREVQESTFKEVESERNSYSSSAYRSIQFTCRQLIKYKNPFLQEFIDLRKSAKQNKEEDLSKKILAMDYSHIARDVRFFYPYEVQIVDQGAHAVNSEGEASHGENKKTQVRAAQKRIFGPLIELLGVTDPNA
ncbi:MAG: TIGR04552 family protein [Halobacteriovoraceae bacterium]|nr:TIGR04552 family protein [Halobacteriovoraceae bacterium]